MLTLYRVVPARLEYYLEVTSAGTPGPFYERAGYWRVPGALTADPSAVIDSDRLLGLGRGIDPRTGEVRNRYQDRVRTCALDLTFAAPKGVSVLGVLGDDEVRAAIADAQRKSVFETMDFVDRKIISVSRRVDGIRTMRRARTIDQALFEHRVSRSLDPHLHSHVLIPNLASDDQRCWSALDLRPPYVHVGLLGSLYRSGLRSHLSESLGVHWREIRPGWYDLEGLSPPMVRAFSQRRQQIVNELADRGLSSHRATEIAAGHSRPARGFAFSYGELLETWRTRAHRLGISSARLEELTGRRQIEREELHRQVDRAISAVGARAPEVMLFHLLREVADGARSGSSVGDLERAVERAVASRVISAPRELWPYGPRRGRTGGRELLVGVDSAHRGKISRLPEPPRHRSMIEGEIAQRAVDGRLLGRER